MADKLSGINKILNGLDEDQLKAVTVNKNAVVSAGAGSGKTRVLASRYAWLLTEKKYKPDEILALTFTNKAVSEMYSRIYEYLLNCGEIAFPIMENFHKARISTLDSFSAGIARTASSRYGISSDFTSAGNSLTELAKESALVFVLNHREDEAIRELLVDHKIKSLAENIFAEFVIEYGSVSSPVNLEYFYDVQRKILNNKYIKITNEITEMFSNIKEELNVLRGKNKSIGLTRSLEEIFNKAPIPELPSINGESYDADKMIEYINYLAEIIKIKTPPNYGEVYDSLVDYFRSLKGKDENGLYHEFESIINCILNLDLTRGLFRLLEIFQTEFNNKKRETGFLSFNDIARLAVDALKDHPDIRRAYKENLKMLMIDEFQDNNALQRDLIYLLAENPERMETGLPGIDELEKDMMFFVGDEKQSIYRFRGADVAVFRSLVKDELSHIELNFNYRSRPMLIKAFNKIFSGVFPLPESGAPDYEAEYRGINSPGEISDKDKPLLHFCFLNEDDLSEDDSEGIKTQDLESVFIAGKIKEMMNDSDKKLSYEDFCVLERSYTHQAKLEKYFREFNIPYSTDRPSGFFDEALIQDILALLKLLVYPEDRLSYAALIRSPFMRLSDLSLAVCMLNNTEPFAEENEELIPEEEIELYRMARERYNALSKKSRVLSVTELLTRIWYDEAYRFETLWNESLQVYEGLFDLFFSLAAEADAEGKSLAEFIEHVEDIINKEIKNEDMELPPEGRGGVRILSIHKSKGLEFPFVFIFNAASSGNSRVSNYLLDFHEEYGPIYKAPQADKMPLGGNFFKKIYEDEEKQKNDAELKRLLYVAMTRAESELFLTFTIPKQTADEKKDWDSSTEEFSEDTIIKRLHQLEEKLFKSGNLRRDNFLKLLQPIIPECYPSLCSLEIIPVLDRAGIYKLIEQNTGMDSTSRSILSVKEAALKAEALYETADILPAGEAGDVYYSASKLKIKGSGIGSFAGESLEPADDLMGLDPKDFGSQVHAILEAKLKNTEYKILPVINSIFDSESKQKKILSLAESMAEKFLSSDLGLRCTSSNFMESELSVITSISFKKTMPVMGQIDLLFEEDDKIVLVDFKTDRAENPQTHYGQLAVYSQAAGDIYKKPVSVWLFYLRSGNALELTKEIEKIALEDLVIDDIIQIYNENKVNKNG